MVQHRQFRPLGARFPLATAIRLSSSNRIIPRFMVSYEHDYMGSADIEIETSDSVSLYAGVNGGFWSNGTEVSYG